MDPAQRTFLLTRAGQRCEYCRLPQSALDLQLQVDHVIARQHRGETTVDNLCVACDLCNLKKGPNLASIDPLTGELVPFSTPAGMTGHSISCSIARKFLGRPRLAAPHWRSWNSTHRDGVSYASS
jgi:hypothetical protein